MKKPTCETCKFWQHNPWVINGVCALTDVWTSSSRSCCDHPDSHAWMEWRKNQLKIADSIDVGGTSNADDVLDDFLKKTDEKYGVLLKKLAE